MPNSASMREGGIVALTADVIGDVGAYSIYPWTAALEPVQVVSFLPGPYRVPAYRGRVRGVATSKAPMGPYRGVGRPVSTFVMERLIDMAARRLSLDPVELRRRNLVRAGGISLPNRLRHRLGPLGLSRDARQRLRGDRLRRLREEQAKARAAGRLLRDRYRHLCRADRHRFAHLGGTGDADQYRHRDRDDPAQFDRRGHRQLRDRLARPGAGDYARPGDCRRARRQARRYPDIAGRQRRRRARDRHLRQPQRGAGWRRRDAGRAPVEREDRSRRRRICWKRRSRTSTPQTAGCSSSAPIAR